MKAYKTPYTGPVYENTIEEVATLPSTVSDDSIYVVVGTAVNRHRTSDIKAALNAMFRKIGHDHRIEKINQG